MNFWPLLLLFSGGVILTVGDIIMKKWVINNSHVFYLLGLAVYIVGLNFLAQSYHFRNIAGASVVMTIINVILLLGVTYFYFKEPLSTLQLIGVALGIIAIVFLELPNYLQGKIFLWCSETKQNAAY
jgi:multidrug transporter EmrE-like cation transporter